MPIHHAIWTVGTNPEPLNLSKLATEKELEDMITARPEILSDEWMLIGRQEKTGFGGIIDLLAIAPDGSLVLIELKRDQTPREIVAQALDYASWVEGLAAKAISRISSRSEVRLAISRRSAGKALEAVMAETTNAAAHDRSEKASPRRAIVK